MVRVAIHAGLVHNLDLVYKPEAATILCLVENMKKEKRIRSYTLSYPRGETPDGKSKVKDPRARFLLMTSDA